MNNQYRQNFDKIGELLYQMETPKPKRVKKEWSPEEDKLLIQAVRDYGNSWSRISKEVLKGQRSGDACRNRFNYLIKMQQRPVQRPDQRAVQKPVQRAVQRPVQRPAQSRIHKACSNRRKSETSKSPACEDNKKYEPNCKWGPKNKGDRNTCNKVKKQQRSITTAKKEYVERRDRSGRKTKYLVRIGNRGGKYFIQNDKKIQLDRDAKTVS